MSGTSLTSGTIRSVVMGRHASLLCIVMVILGGCSSSQMRFHFAAANLDDTGELTHLTFYRVTVNGGSGLSKSNLLTGFYDTKALHSLFGTVTDPGKDSSGVKTADSNQGIGNVVVQFNPTSKTWQAVPDDQKFTIFWGTNADAMSQQVAAFAQSDQTGDDLASLLAAAAGNSTYDQARTAKQALNDKTSAKSTLVSTLTSIEAELKKNPTANLADVREQLRQAEQAALIAAGSTTTLDKDPTKATADAESELKLLKASPQMK